jgi:hypothetical protein
MLVDVGSGAVGVELAAITTGVGEKIDGVLVRGRKGVGTLPG